MWWTYNNGFINKKQKTWFRHCLRWHFSPIFRLALLRYILSLCVFVFVATCLSVLAYTDLTTGLLSFMCLFVFFLLVRKVYISPFSWLTLLFAFRAIFASSSSPRCGLLLGKLLSFWCFKTWLTWSLQKSRGFAFARCFVWS